MYPNMELERNAMEEKRENLGGNTIEAVKEEVEDKSGEELSKPISENNGLNEDREEEDPTSVIPITKYLRSKKKQVDCSSLVAQTGRPALIRESGVDSSLKDELEIPLKANGRPSRMKRKSQCVDCDTEEEVLANSRTQERKRNMGKNKGKEQDNDEVMKRAEEVKAKLDKRFPSFLKPMLRSHASRLALLHIPVHFSKPYMTKEDKILILEDETGKEYKVKYIAGKTALSAGWGRFSRGHNLLEGDVVVFHLLRSDKFKVYIVRVSSSGEIDGAIDYSNRAIHPIDEHEINDEDSPIRNMDDGHHNSFIEFHEFNITVNGANLDSLLAQDVRKNYYELCLARNSYLHHHLQGSNNMLAAGIISETTKIADYIKGSKLSTSSDDFTMWAKILEGFEVLGMDVGFLRAQLKKLMDTATTMKASPRFKEYEEARLQRDCIDEEIQNLKSRMHELDQAKMKLESNIDVLKVEVEKFEFMFEVEANTPWSL